MDIVTGIAITTLLSMMLQTEHERCDRVRAGWREVRRSIFAATSAIQRAQQRRAILFNLHPALTLRNHAQAVQLVQRNWRDLPRTAALEVFCRVHCKVS